MENKKKEIDWYFLVIRGLVIGVYIAIAWFLYTLFK